MADERDWTQALGDDDAPPTHLRINRFKQHARSVFTYHGLGANKAGDVWVDVIDHDQKQRSFAIGLVRRLCERCEGRVLVGGKIRGECGACEGLTLNEHGVVIMEVGEDSSMVSTPVQVLDPPIVVTSTSEPFTITTTMTVTNPTQPAPPNQKESIMGRPKGSKNKSKSEVSAAVATTTPPNTVSSTDQTFPSAPPQKPATPRKPITLRSGRKPAPTTPTEYHDLITAKVRKALDTIASIAAPSQFGLTDEQISSIIVALGMATVIVEKKLTSPPDNDLLPFTL